jgi:5-methylcytosine-specific restriction endonuclease McrA
MDYTRIISKQVIYSELFAFLMRFIEMAAYLQGAKSVGTRTNIWYKPIDWSLMTWRYSFNYGCMYLYINHNKALNGDWGMSGWDEFRLLCRDQQFSDYDMQSFDLIIQSALINITPTESIRPCENPNCVNPLLSEQMTRDTPSYFMGGKWVCEQCRIKYSLPAPVFELPNTGNKTQTPAEIERSKMTISLRFQILEKDNFSCRVCGRNPRDHGVVLHVDHIKPIAHGGLTEIENLQTLCADCNLAKGVKEFEQMALW